jgi:hypothetical protein
VDGRNGLGHAELQVGAVEGEERVFHDGAHIVSVAAGKAGQFVGEFAGGVSRGQRGGLPRAVTLGQVEAGGVAVFETGFERGFAVPVDGFQTGRSVSACGGVKAGSTWVIFRTTGLGHLRSL